MRFKGYMLPIEHTRSCVNTKEMAGHCELDTIQWF